MWWIIPEAPLETPPTKIAADPQTNVTQVFIHPEVEIEPEQSLYNFILNFTPPSSIVCEIGVRNLDFVPSHIRLSGADLELAQALDNRSVRKSVIHSDCLTLPCDWNKKT